MEPISIYIDILVNLYLGSPLLKVLLAEYFLSNLPVSVSFLKILVKNRVDEDEYDMKIHSSVKITIKYKQRAS